MEVAHVAGNVQRGILARAGIGLVVPCRQAGHDKAGVGGPVARQHDILPPCALLDAALHMQDRIGFLGIQVRSQAKMIEECDKGGLRHRCHSPDRRECNRLSAIGVCIALPMMLDERLALADGPEK